MKIAFTATGGNWDSVIDPRFGRTAYIVLFDEKSKALNIFDNRMVNNEAHGAGAVTAQKVFNLKPDVLITGNGPGETAMQALKHIKMKIFVNAHKMTLQQAYEQYKRGRLQEI